MPCSISAMGSRGLIAGFRLRLSLARGKGGGGSPLWLPLVAASASVLGLSGLAWPGLMYDGGGNIALQKPWPSPAGDKAPLTRLRGMTIV